MWEASAFFTAVHVGYIVGSLVGGVVYDLLSKSLALVVGVVGMGVFVAITPFCAQFGIMVTVCLLAALSAGVVDTGTYLSLDISFFFLPLVYTNVRARVCMCLFVWFFFY